MDFDKASLYFKNLLKNTKSSDTEKFVRWSKEFIDDYLDDLESHTEDNASIVLAEIREEIRQSLPLEAITKTEKITPPTTGQNADCDDKTTVHVDGFLYDEEAIDALVDEGKLSRNYCTECLSKSTKPLTFITHSASVTQIKYFFQYLLQDMRGKTILDVGSRTGAVLYGAHLFSEAPRIVGVEIDSTFCQLQNTIVNKYKMADRIQIIHSDILHQGDLLKSSDVVILNNVFEFFLPLKQQLHLWKFLYKTVRKKGATIISIPSIEESLTSINSKVDVTSWLEPINLCQQMKEAALKLFKDEETSDLDEIFMYQVL